MNVTENAVDKFLQDLTGRYAEQYTKAIQDLYVALVTENKADAIEAKMQLARAMRETMGIAEIVGAKLTLEAVADLDKSAKMRADNQYIYRFQQSLVPQVTFDEALQQLAERAPVTVRKAADRTAQRIAELYSEKNIIAFARSAEATVTKEAKAYIERAMRLGVTEGKAARELAMRVNSVRKKSAEWSEAYARTVWRTNVNSAVTAGRFRQAQDPAVKAIVPALRYDAVGDSDTRSNHLAADGIILRSDNPQWAKIAPPLGYNCRCQVSLVSVVQLRAMGLIDSKGQVRESKVPYNAKPDDGFRHGGRPDLALANR